MIRKTSSIVLLAIFLASTTASTGCIGRMALSGQVRKFNLEVADGKWGRELVFLLLYIIPVYPIAGAIDLLIINSIEFHSGKNPISGDDRLARAGETRDVTGPDGSRVVSTLRADGSIDLEITSPDGSKHFTNVIRSGETITARDAHGNAVGTIRNGQVELARADAD